MHPQVQIPVPITTRKHSTMSSHDMINFCYYFDWCIEIQMDIIYQQQMCNIIYQFRYHKKGTNEYHILTFS